MREWHSLLGRQLKRCFGGLDAVPGEVIGFAEMVQSAYEQFDDDRRMLERSLELSSQELLHANSEMRAIFQALPDLFLKLDRHGTIVDFRGGRTRDFYISVECLRLIRNRYDLSQTKLILLATILKLQVKQEDDISFDETLAKPIRQSILTSVARRLLGRVSHDAGLREAQASAEAKNFGRKNYRVLVVEDNSDNSRSVGKMLSAAGYESDVADNGAAAVEAVRLRRYDVIMMDIYMPVVDGFEATEKIRQLERSRQEARTPIIALTAHAISGYREKCLGRGMDDFVTKPLKKSTLLKTIGRWLDPRPTVLVADDVFENRMLLQTIMGKQSDLNVLVAKNGVEAIELFRRYAVSLILMDLEMPGMNGLEATARIRELPAGGDVAVIALTAHSDKEQIERCLSAGCTGFLKKPIRRKELLRTIRRHLYGQATGEETVVRVVPEGAPRPADSGATSRLFEKLPNSETDRQGIPTARERNES